MGTLPLSRRSDPFMFPCGLACDLATDTCVLMSPSQAYLALLAWTPAPLTELPSEKQYFSPKDPKAPHPLPSIHDAASLDLSIIIPAYNETGRLPSMLSSTLEHLASFPKRTFEILIVDDGSSDGTADAALELGARRHAGADIRVVRLERNLGKGGTVRHGMLHARGRRLLMADADGATRFADVELLLAALDKVAPAESDAAGVAIGSRAHLVRTEAVVKVRLFFSCLFVAIIWRLPLGVMMKFDSGIFCSTEVTPAQFPHVRFAHRAAHRGRRARSRHAVRVQAIFARGRAGAVPATAPRNVDIRRRAATARQNAGHSRRGGAGDVARGRGEQTERREGFAADASRFVGAPGEPIARAVEHAGEGRWKIQGGIVRGGSRFITFLTIYCPLAC